MADAENRLIIAGGGLAGSLTALALAKLQPEVPILPVESGESFGGNHIWSFFDPDINARDRWLVEPLVTARWDGYYVCFPKRRRTLETAYSSISSDRLDQVVRKELQPAQYRLESAIEVMASNHVRLENGETIAAAGVIDARGLPDLSPPDLGWQKFLGREYRFDRPHGVSRPIVMDATVDQAAGYRFVYCLPLSSTRMLIEDTYYSLSPALDMDTLRKRIDAYLQGHSWQPVEMEREETGVLPIAMGGSLDALWDQVPDMPKLGLRGGFFHPTTGYSLPDAVRMALLVARQPDLSSAGLHSALKLEATRVWNKCGFYRSLGRMLFSAAPPSQRYKLLEHFYRLDPDLIGRFYADRSTFADKARIVSGKPPVSVGSAIGALLGKGKHSK